MYTYHRAHAHAHDPRGYPGHRRPAPPYILFPRTRFWDKKDINDVLSMIQWKGREGDGDDNYRISGDREEYIWR